MNGEQHPGFWRDDSDEVIAVNPADLRSVWNMTQQTTATLGLPTSVDHRVLERVGSPGANLEAVWFRASILWMLPTVLTDSTVEVAATFPMKKMKVGSVSNQPPFDLQEFMRRVAELTKG